MSIEKKIAKEQRRQRIAHAHFLVADTAKQMGHELFERAMQQNDWYELLKKKNPGADLQKLENQFVEKMWPTLVEEARATLVGMLRTPIDETSKERIMEALLLDNQLVRGRKAGGHIKLN